MDLDIDLNDFYILCLIYQASTHIEHQPNELYKSLIAAGLSIRQSTIHKKLSRLEREGTVVMRKIKSDLSPKKEYFLTDSGVDLVRDVAGELELLIYRTLHR